jgi:hypothetical protein
MTKNEWAAELQATLVSAGSEWRVFKAWVELNSPMMCAEVTSASHGRAKRITLARDRFATAEERSVEIHRQLYGDSQPAPIKTGRRKEGGRS